MRVWRVALKASAIALVEAETAQEAAALAQRCALGLGGKELHGVRMETATLGPREHHVLDINGGRHASRATGPRLN